MRVGILTSGGDAPGMNAAVRAAVRRGWELNLKPVGIRRGYAGLIEGDMASLTPRDVGGVIEHGGTFLHTARCPAFLTPEGQRQALETIEREGLEALIVIGGEGSLSGARWLSQQGVPVVGLPASIDNDIQGTDMAIGVDTALNTVVWALNRIRDTALAHERVFTGCNQVQLLTVYLVHYLLKVMEIDNALIRFTAHHERRFGIDKAPLYKELYCKPDEGLIEQCEIALEEIEASPGDLG